MAVVWQLIDSASHRLRWLPKRLRRWICDRYDLSLGMTRGDLDWTTNDRLTEPQIRQRWRDENWQVVTPVFVPSGASTYRTWACEHMTISGPIPTAPEGWCHCQMQQV
jgi:hypothetical protein